MAVDRATVNVSASVLSDNIKVAVGGTTVYDIDDTGDNNRWMHFRGIVTGTTQRDLVNQNDLQYVNQNIEYNDTPLNISEPNDDVVFILIKNSGYAGVAHQQSSTGTPSTADLYVGLSAGDIGVNSGTIVIGPGECWFAKLRGEAMSHIHCASSSSDDLLYDVYAILDQGGI
jgi:streptogramin lyase